jgi:hypothetical protein
LGFRQAKRPIKRSRQHSLSLTQSVQQLVNARARTHTHAHTISTKPIKRAREHTHTHTTTIKRARLTNKYPHIHTQSVPSLLNARARTHARANTRAHTQIVTAKRKCYQEKFAKLFQLEKKNKHLRPNCTDCMCVCVHVHACVECMCVCMCMCLPSAGLQGKMHPCLRVLSVCDCVCCRCRSKLVEPAGKEDDTPPIPLPTPPPHTCLPHPCRNMKATAFSVCFFSFLFQPVSALSFLEPPQGPELHPLTPNP